LPRRNGGTHGVADLLRWARIDPDIDITTVDHIATLNKAATLCSLGPHVDALTLERCLDDFLRTDSSRWLDDAMKRLGSRKPGGVKALEEIRDHPKRAAGVTDSWMERVTAQLIAVPWLPPIVLQHPVEVDGRRFRIDIACPELLLGVEAHGRSFHWGAGKEDADNVRDLHIGTQGWQLLYITFSQLRQPDHFVRLFAATARARATQLGVALHHSS
jgi:very-short-patch-repair endonuclease